ncbi:MAG TPA: T9SS type A sorting domain-containing protein [Saprospiraceae bacterium]|nr:T9SS type A sorting domain-containing protein [Saprospiraceae bacterium]
MKKTVTLIFLVISISFSNAQPCDQGKAKQVLHANNISAKFKVGGDLFFDDKTGEFIINANILNPPLATIFLADLWMSAIDLQGVRRIAVQYARGTNLSYLPFGTTQSDCNNWDHIWSVGGEQLKAHIQDWKTDYKIDNKIPQIYAWPAKGNPYFESENNFPLSTNIKQWAEFYDQNKDGIYNPDDGDFPAVIDPNTGNAVIPDVIFWYMFNDDAVENNTIVKPLNVLTQLTAYEFKGDNDVINNTLFTSYKFISRGLDTLKNFKPALLVDFDMGCPWDDYVGCSRDLSAIFVYNADSIDGLTNGSCSGTNTFGDNPGVQAVSFLSDSLFSFIHSGNSALYQSSSFLNMIDTKFDNGQHLLNSGDGTTGIPTNYAFDGNPNKPDEWSMKSVFLKGQEFRGLGSVNLGNLNPGDIKPMTVAYTFFNSNTIKATSVDIDSMYSGVKYLHELYDGFFEEYSVATNSINEKEVLVYPNPVSNQLHIISPNEVITSINLVDMYGRIVSSAIINSNETDLDASSVEAGSYLLLIHFDHLEMVRMVVVIK